MQRDLANASLAAIRQRISEGDCPSTPPYHTEILEHLVVQFADERNALLAALKDARAAIDAVLSKGEQPAA